MRMRGLLCSIILGASVAWAQLPPLSLQLPSLDLRTGFGHDYGDILHSIRFQGKDYEPSQATQPILIAAGWTTRSDKLQLGAVVNHLTAKNLRTVGG